MSELVICSKRFRGYSKRSLKILLTILYTFWVILLFLIYFVISRLLPTQFLIFQLLNSPFNLWRYQKRVQNFLPSRTYPPLSWMRRTVMENFWPWAYHQYLLHYFKICLIVCVWYTSEEAMESKRLHHNQIIETTVSESIPHGFMWSSLLTKKCVNSSPQSFLSVSDYQVPWILPKTLSKTSRGRCI